MIVLQVLGAWLLLAVASIPVAVWMVKRAQRNTFGREDG